MRKSWLVLGVGDLFAIGAVTMIGFATHGEAGLSFLPRMLTTFFPLSIAWFLLAPWLGLFTPGITSTPQQIWRPVLAMILAAPLAGLLRAVLLNSVVIPVFVLVLGATTTLAILIWRLLYFVLTRKIPPTL